MMLSEEKELTIGKMTTMAVPYNEHIVITGDEAMRMLEPNKPMRITKEMLMEWDKEMREYFGEDYDKDFDL